MLTERQIVTKNSSPLRTLTKNNSPENLTDSGSYLGNPSANFVVENEINGELAAEAVMKFLLEKPSENLYGKVHCC